MPSVPRQALRDFEFMAFGRKSGDVMAQEPSAGRRLRLGRSKSLVRVSSNPPRVKGIGK